jgi:hypothetical protein
MPDPAGLARWVGRPVRLRGEAHQEGIVKDYRTDPPGLLVVLDYSEDLGDPIWFSLDELESFGGEPLKGWAIPVPESGRPSPVTWSRVDRELYPEIEKAIAEVFPGESDRVRLAAVAVWNVVMNRVPESDRIEGMSWCRHFDRAIDYRLVKEDRPACIEERHGCAGCPESTYRVHRVPDR